MKRPSVCVLIPVWKDQKGLDVTLEALAKDSFEFDVVVVDDGSPTPITAPESAGPHAIRLIRLTRNAGIEHALNRGLEFIFERGYAYIARLDCADTPVTGRICKQIRYLEENPAVAIVGTWARCVNDDGDYLFTLRFPSKHAAMVRKQKYVPAMLHPTVMLRSSALQDVGKYSDQFKTAEDYELFIRISNKYNIANIPEVLTEYIISDGGTTKSKRQRNLIARLRVQAHYFDWLDVHAYLGILRTALLLVIPFDLLVKVKKAIWR